MNQSKGKLLQCHAVESGYGASKVLFGVDFTVHAGEVVGLLGRNGMGKSTLIKTILGVLPTLGGEISFDGHSVQGKKTYELAQLGIAVVPEGRRCFGNLTVDEHLKAFSALRNASISPWSRDELYELFPRLKERMLHLGRELSGGEQQMLAIARALSTNPKLLILDEATEGLAPIIRSEIWACLAKLRSDSQTIVIVDKYLDELMALADRHMILEKGKAVWSGTSAELGADRGLWARYLGV